MLVAPVHVEHGGAKLRPHGDLAPRSGAVAVEASRGFGPSSLCTQQLSTSSTVEDGLTRIWCLDRSEHEHVAAGLSW
jgi:hypothetical protein